VFFLAGEFARSGEFALKSLATGKNVLGACSQICSQMKNGGRPISPDFRQRIVENRQILRKNAEFLKATLPRGLGATLEHTAV
jgi:hypothetical protein